MYFYAKSLIFYQILAPPHPKLWQNRVLHNLPIFLCGNPDFFKLCYFLIVHRACSNDFYIFFLYLWYVYTNCGAFLRGGGEGGFSVGSQTLQFSKVIPVWTKWTFQIEY